MSKRKRRMQTNRQGNILVIPDKRNYAQEQEILAKPSNAFYGTVVERMMDRLHQPDCTAQEAINIGLTLQQLLRGDAALLNNMDDPAVSEQVAKLKEKAAAEDKANEAWETNQDKFVTQVFDKAEKIAPVGERKAQTIAQGLEQLKQAREAAKARWAIQRQEFQRHLTSDPRVEVIVEPEYESTTINGIVSSIQVKPVLKILDRTFVLDTGRQYLPKILADRYAEHLRTVQENRDRKNVMQKNLERNDYEQEMSRIDQVYGNRRNGQNQIVM